MSSDLRIRPMEISDLDAVVALAGELRDAPNWSKQDYLRALDPDSTPERIALVAEGEGLIGFLVASVQPPEAEIESIAVAVEHQRRGVATELFKTLADILGKRGVVEILLEVRESNRAARALYRALGFIEEGRRPRYYSNPEEDAILMCCKRS